VRYFDVHLHLPTADAAGLARLRAHVAARPGLVGGNLILNTRAEVEFAAAHLGELPSRLNLVPYLPLGDRHPPEIEGLGWYKVHPALQRIEAADLPRVCDSVLSMRPRPQGLIVHCYPWGADIQYAVSVPLVIRLAQALSGTPIVATHGGGYESWRLRAHTGSLPNVLYDFSVSLSYFQGSDLLGPVTQYMRSKPTRILFGSDWPSAEPEQQWAESVRLAAAAGLDEAAMESLLLENARRLWPAAVGAAAGGAGR
jgi:predicted TIM-barrel fold metal-dependent hydrolase